MTDPRDVTKQFMRDYVDPEAVLNWEYDGERFGCRLDKEGRLETAVGLWRGLTQRHGGASLVQEWRLTTRMRPADLMLVIVLRGGSVWVTLGDDLEMARQ